MRFISYCSIAFILVTFSSMCSAQANSEQALQAFNAQYAELLARHTTVGEKVSMPARMVDYSALSGDPEWATLVQALAEFPIAGLHTQDQKGLLPQRLQYSFNEHGSAALAITYVAVVRFHVGSGLGPQCRCRGWRKCHAPSFGKRCFEGDGRPSGAYGD